MADNSAFISYRRETGYPWARLVWDGLRDRSVDAFFDLESLRAAGRFDERLLNQIAARPYFVPILTQGTLERCADPEDWLRREIEHAIATRRVIVPLFIAPFGPSDFPSAVPGHIDQALGESNGLTIYSQYLEPALDQLVNDRLQPIEIASLPLTADDAEFQHEVEEHVQSLPPPTVPTTPPVDPQADRPTTARPAQAPPTAEQPTIYSPPVPPADPPAPPPGDGGTQPERRSLVPIVAGAVAVLMIVVIAAVVFGGGDDVADPDATRPEVSSLPVTAPAGTGEPGTVEQPPPTEVAAGCEGVLSRVCVTEGEARDDVRELQSMLSTTQFGSLVVDGRFGPNTEAALVAFERRCSTCPDDARIEIDGEEWNRLEEWAAVGLRLADRDGVDALAGNWVLQVAAYGTCLFPDNPFDPGAVRGLHDAFDGRLAGLGGAVLASGDEANLHTDGGSGCYFSFLNRAFASPDDARQLCADELAGECFPKFVSDDPSVSVAEGP